MAPNDSLAIEDLSSCTQRYVGVRLFLRLFWRSIYRTRDTAGRLTLKRFALICLVLPWFLLLVAAHRVCLLLDNVVFPGYRKVQIKDPVFIVGIPRSGTTFLYHLLAEDTRNFTAFHLWELIAAPSILERKFWMCIARLDKLLGGPGYRLAIRIENRLLDEMRKIHYISLFKPDEDELVLVSFFATALLLVAFPFPEELWSLVRFDLTVPPRLRQRIMAHYAACVKRHLYFHGPDKHFLSKNPMFSSKIDALYETFPDARIICNVRNPYEAVPSLMSLLSFFWRVFDNDKQETRLRDASLDVVQHFYRHPIERLTERPADRHAFVRYNDLAPDPRGVVCGLYDRFGLAMSPEYDRRLVEEQQRARSYKSRNAYSLDQYELSPERIRTDFRDVFAYFNFNTEAPAPAAR